MNQQIINGNDELAYKQIDLLKEKKIISVEQYNSLKDRIY